MGRGFGGGGRVHLQSRPAVITGMPPYYFKIVRGARARLLRACVMT